MGDLPWWTGILLVPAVVLGVLQLWALVDAFRTPPEFWHQAGIPKYLWISIVWYSFGIGAAVYLLRIRPLLRARPVVDVVGAEATVR